MLDCLEPIRDVSFSVEHLEEHARTVGASHTVDPKQRHDRRLWRRFEDNSRVLEESYQAILLAADKQQGITSGAEWLLDNYYVVRDQTREIRHDLPQRYYHELPKLSTGPLAGKPRVYALALEVISHCDSAVDDEMLTRFVQAYQQSAPLTIGELWAIPIMLRLGLIENLRRLAHQIVLTQVDQQRVDKWIDDTILERPADVCAYLNDRCHNDDNLSSPLVIRLVQRCRDEGHDLAACWHWLEQRVSANGESVDDIVRQEYQRQACNQVSTGNVITSMRLLSALDWSVFFEQVSLVDQQLRRDPAGVYDRMDFATRDRYRRVVERLAKRSTVDELEVSRRAVQMAATADVGQPVARHVGYYLIDEGLLAFLDNLGCRPSLPAQVGRWLGNYAITLYCGGISLVMLFVLAGLTRLGDGSWETSLLIVLVALVPASELAVSLLNFAATKLFPPTVLPKLEFKEGIPPEYKTMVVVPTLIINKQGVKALVERLEIHFLANPDANLAFAILADFPDSPEQQMPEDEALLAEAAKLIQDLNDRYPHPNARRFWLFHRPRQWNPLENTWMAWERKRGKLSEFNRLLRGARDTSFVLEDGMPAELRTVKYVITLDTDTQLPLGAARRLIGTMAHPLNQVVTADDVVANRVTKRTPTLGSSCVVRGYTILQPRVSLNLISARRTPFSLVYSGNPSLDPYVTAVSDVYQDCFGEGSYTGKGIYDVDAFESTLGETFPDNLILSHDLIEGCHARVALVTDVELVDDYPAHYHAYSRRQHRWTRGDWQILPWLFRRVPLRHGTRNNPLSAISRWKVFDNLRRSLVAPSVVAMLMAGWLMLPGPYWIWTVFGLAILGLPFGLRLLGMVLSIPSQATWGQYLVDQLADLRTSLSQMVLSVAFLLDQARLMLDAILRTLLRMYVTRRRLLEWETAAVTESRFRPTMRSFFATMWTSPAAAFILAGLIMGGGGTEALLAASPVLLLWLTAPFIAFQSSRPYEDKPILLSSQDKRELRDIARRTWLFFETYVTEQDQWLPPDNYQEHPKGIVAHRTSPTNEGLFLVSALAARDLGYLGLHDFADLLERNLHRWSSLDRYRGHPLNWYDTLTGQVLHPAYVSTVDSGNLGVCLLTVRQGLFELVNKPVFDAQLWQGLIDALRLDCHTEVSLNDPQQETRREAQPLWDLLTKEPAPVGVNRWRRQLAELNRRLGDTFTPAPPSGPTGTIANTNVASRAALPNVSRDGNPTPFRLLAKQVRQFQNDLLLLFPWREATTSERTAAAHHAAPAAVQLESEQTESNGAESKTAEPNQPEPHRPEWTTLDEILNSAVSLRQLAQLRQATAPVTTTLADALVDDANAPGSAEQLDRLAALRSSIDITSAAAVELVDRFLRIAERCQTLVAEMDFSFLYNPQRRLFSIGYNVAVGQRDRSHYDLLASEARLASFLAIGKGDTEHGHWFQLGRPLTQTASSRCLLSWGGTMFEYLMPQLFLHAYGETLIDHSCRTAVDRQIEFGRQTRLPWGISESAFAALDGQANYQYQSFGVPGLGLKRGLSEEVVVSPYSTALALAVHPRAALANFRDLTRHGALGPFGFYDAIDFTPDRQPLNVAGRATVVRCYMAHHQGMTLIAIANRLLDDVMPQRFHCEATTRATAMLLQERIPLATPLVAPHRDEVVVSPEVRETVQPISRWITTPDTSSPRTHVLSNASYAVMVTNAGGGYSQCDGLQLTRWRPDTVRDAWGQFIYVRDLRTNNVWSAGFQPTRRPADSYEVLFSVDKAEFRRRDGDIETHLEIAVSPEHNAEVRQLVITNHGSRARHLDVTSYAELALNTLAADVAHPAFQKLFIQTEFLADRNTLLAMRRPRSTDERVLWAVHTVAFEMDHESTVALRDGETEGEPPAHRSRVTEFETDRSKFLGRGQTPAQPAALQPHAKLSNTCGAVLDPIFSLRHNLQLDPGQSTRLAFTTALAKSREEALSLADQYHDLRVVLRVFELAWAHSQVELRHRHLSPADAHLYQRLASHLIYPDAAHRAPPAVLSANRQGQAGLWRYGISGDNPIVLVRITQPRQDGLVRELLLAHEYWRAKCLVADLVVLNEHPTGYVDEVQDHLQRVIGESGTWGQLNKPGGIFILNASRMPNDDCVLLQAAAHVVLRGDAGSLGAQLDLPTPPTRRTSRLPLRRQASNRVVDTEGHLDTPTIAHDSQFFNGQGGFRSDGREYTIVLRPGEWTPAPWCNVIANPTFGCVISESGSGLTWAQNSRDNKLTPWSNDSVSDDPSEAIYLRDDETGEFWSPTPLPVRGAGTYVVHHGQGYSRFEHVSNAIAHEVLISIATGDPIKFVCLTLRNNSGRRRRLSAMYYAEWVLGVSREQTQMHVITQIDEVTGALLATNAFHPEYSRRVAFMQVIGRECTVTGDRKEFLGRNGDWDRPQAMIRTSLSGLVGAGLDPCGAVHTRIDLAAGEEVEIVFVLGQADNEIEAHACLARYASSQQVRAEIQKTCTSWENLLGTLEVKTPDSAFDLLVNRWLLYQVTSCRLWARTAFYQCGGAYGFRDQLQDVMALVYSAPHLAREHILRAARRQYEQGDVQHWWHLPTGRGVRTRFSDDALWLPYVVSHYLRTTSDLGILDEPLPFLHSPPLDPHEQERYELPEISPQVDTLYGHCLRAVDLRLSVGTHGLPLMGCGDWNDGMNRVGIDGRGESVWLGWFLLDVLNRLIPVVDNRGETERANYYRDHAATLLAAIEEHGWDGPDGRWYRRAYFDDGTPLGSRDNDECKIDSLAQSWSVIAGGDSQRSRTAMQSAIQALVRPDQRVVCLLTPPFDSTPLDPGYIKGYLPGIRENGGQYTHAALWLVQALATLNECDHAMSLFNLLSPIYHSDSPHRRDTYQVEPYVVAADVYSRPPHEGRGGWTWYTGSAGWMYRVALESILGFQLRGDHFRLEPRIPSTWAGFELLYRQGKTIYRVAVERSALALQGKTEVMCDNQLLPGLDVPLQDDGKTHEVRIRIS